MPASPDPDPLDYDATEPVVNWDTLEASGRALINPPEPPAD